jgi:hypothetical protein
LEKFFKDAAKRMVLVCGAGTGVCHYRFVCLVGLSLFKQNLKMHVELFVNA